ITAVEGSNRVSGVTAAPFADDGSLNLAKQFHLGCDTILLSVGLVPENELTRGIGAEIDLSTGGPYVDEDLMTSIPGLFACGNVLQVHDLADMASEEAERAGLAAALYTEGWNSSNGLIISVTPGRGVRFTVPQRLTGTKSAVMSLRPSQPMEKARISVSDRTGTIYFTKNIKNAHPSEMIQFLLKLPWDIPRNTELEVHCE
ncbi:MAG: FAD-dependent oxidoreductase, partial [Spirochaetales bacterium]|nr:FAD-dependent oxidoreductase [Spirochaetales bacterium]